MKRFLVIAYDQYYPSGFPDEVRYSSDDLDDAIEKAKDIAVGRGYISQFIDRNLSTRVNDDMAKVEAADLLINWAKNYLR